MGGPTIDPEVFCDASFASVEERRSVTGHCLRMGPNSGVIYSNVSTIKSAVKSVFEAETYAPSDGQDTLLYVKNMVAEFMMM